MNERELNERCVSNQSLGVSFPVISHNFCDFAGPVNG